MGSLRQAIEAKCLELEATDHIVATAFAAEFRKILDAHPVVERRTPPIKPGGKFLDDAECPVGTVLWCSRGDDYEGYHIRQADGTWSGFYATNPELFKDTPGARLANRA